MTARQRESGAPTLQRELGVTPSQQMDRLLHLLVTPLDGPETAPREERERPSTQWPCVRPVSPAAVGLFSQVEAVQACLTQGHWTVNRSVGVPDSYHSLA